MGEGLLSPEHIMFMVLGVVVFTGIGGGLYAGARIMKAILHLGGEMLELRQRKKAREDDASKETLLPQRSR